MEISFPSAFQPGRYRLLELSDDHLLNHFLSSSSSVSIRGRSSDQATLVTPSRTYVLKERVTSNTILVIRPTSSPSPSPTLESKSNESTNQPDQSTNQSEGFVLDMFSSVWECQHVPIPSLERLRDLLSHHIVHEDQYNVTYGDEGVSWSTITEEVQASDDEIKKGLHVLNALELPNGRFGLLSESATLDALRVVMASLRVEGWSPTDTVQIDTVLQLIRDQNGKDDDGPPEFVLRHCLRRMCEEVGYGFVVSKDKVSRFLATWIFLKDVDKKQIVDEFMREWQHLVDEVVGEDTFRVDIAMLSGIALVDVVGLTKVPVLRYFPATTMPNELADRVSLLFQKRTKWTFDEMLPYITDISDDRKKLEALLLKHTRSSVQPNGTKLYTSRAPVKSK